ncbi:peptidoglycan editing factor PgeF [Melioribacteraceae bacterium 4301-Me]|uniref:peptidoglycan editing factor PgeF n=1 Tax=Pyranulibacter aquaticus TaxID=3163344 RepID=UPI0035989A7E
MKIIYSRLFERFPEIIFGFSTKVGLNRPAPYYFNLSLSVGDDSNNVIENRNFFFKQLGLSSNEIAYQRQIHSDLISIVDRAGFVGESDAMITSKKGIGLAISAADCVPIFIYDKKNNLIAAVHSGWRGTYKKILAKTLLKLQYEFNSMPNNLFVCLGPSISQKKYEVGQDVANLFDEKYLIKKNNKFYLNIVQANIDMLLNAGVPENNIEQSNLCTFEEKNLLHSYRRDGKNSGRSLGIIALKNVD